MSEPASGAAGETQYVALLRFSAPKVISSNVIGRQRFISPFEKLPARGRFTSPGLLNRCTSSSIFSVSASRTQGASSAKSAGELRAYYLLDVSPLLSGLSKSTSWPRCHPDARNKIRQPAEERTVFYLTTLVLKALEYLIIQQISGASAVLRTADGALRRGSLFSPGPGGFQLFPSATFFITRCTASAGCIALPGGLNDPQHRLLPKPLLTRSQNLRPDHPRPHQLSEAFRTQL